MYIGISMGIVDCRKREESGLLIRSALVGAEFVNYSGGLTRSIAIFHDAVVSGSFHGDNVTCTRLMVDLMSMILAVSMIFAVSMVLAVFMILAMSMVLAMSMILVMFLVLAMFQVIVVSRVVVMFTVAAMSIVVGLGPKAKGEVSDYIVQVRGGIYLLRLDLEFVFPMLSRKDRERSTEVLVCSDVAQFSEPTIIGC